MNFVMLKNVVFLGLVAVSLVGCKDSELSPAQNAVATMKAESKAEENWEIVETVEYKASTPNEVSALVRRFPEALEYDQEIESLNIDVIHYKYIGPTRCPAGDSRLSYTARTLVLCNPDGGCSGQSEAQSNADPCQ